MQRINHEIQKTVFVPKGTWMASGTISYLEHNESNSSLLVLKDIERKRYDFSVGPYFDYFFRDNISMGTRFTYEQSYLDLSSFDLNLSEDFNISLKNLYYLEHKYEASCFIRMYVSIGKSKVFGLFDETRLTHGHGTGGNSTGSGAEYDGSCQTVQNVQIGLAPSIAAFITDWSVVEISVGVVGSDSKWIDQETNKAERGRQQVSSGNFRINLFSINIGMMFYL